MKRYEVTKYTAKETISYGIMSEEDMKGLLKGYKYDEMLEMWFSPKANIGYDVKEVEF